jgi:signal transduction histidine kinase
MNDSIGARLRRSAITLPMAALAALCVLALNEFTYQQSRASLMLLGDRAVARTEIQTLLRRMVDAETGQRGFLLTGKEDYLAPYQQAAADIQTSLDTLQAHYRSDPEGKRLLEVLVNTSGEKLSELDVTLQMHRQGEHEAWKALTLTDIGKKKMDAMRQASHELLDRETAIVSLGRQELFNTFLVNRVGIGVLTVLGLMGLVFFLRQTRVIDAMRKTHDEELKLEKNLLEQQVVERTADLTDLARYLQTAREDEKARLGRELHDELGALLTAAKLDIARLKRSLSNPTSDVATRLDHLSATINTGIGLKRRIIEDLRPSSLSNLGLLAALQIQLREFAERSELKVRSNLQDISMSPEQEIVVYRFVQEALTNIVKHAKASEIDVSFVREAAEVYLAVRDNGSGFLGGSATRGVHGLLGMRYRIEAVNGRMQVRTEPGSGTTVEAWIPCSM